MTIENFSASQLDKAPVQGQEVVPLNAVLNLSSLCEPGSRVADFSPGKSDTASQFLPDASFLNIGADKSAEGVTNMKADLTLLEKDLSVLSNQLSELQHYLQGFESAPTSASRASDNSVAAAAATDTTAAPAAATATDATAAPAAAAPAADAPGSWTADFTNPKTAKSSLDKIAPVQWGNVSVNSSGGIDLSASPGEPNVAQTGIMTSDKNATDSFGYGTYTFSFDAKSQGGDNGATDGQGAGVYAALWPADNKWPGQEVDAWENWKGQQIATNHWEGAGDSNGMDSHDISGVDPTKENTYTIKWAPDDLGVPSLTEWVNSGAVGNGPLKEIYQTNQNVIADAAHGGINAAPGFGAESSQDGTAGSVATVYGMSYTPLS